MTNLIGHSLGRYHILEQLGQGGMATVYKAYDTRLERNVAVKVLRIDQLTSEDRERSLKRFEREAEAMARLAHPHIVRVLDYGMERTLPYLVMELMPGGTLRDRLRTGYYSSSQEALRGNWQEAISLLLPIAEALEYAHQKGIIHRDVKPSNILFSELNLIALSDFSIAKVLNPADQVTLTRTNMTLGTPEYMAPEQIHSKQVDARADVYSLGVVLYEMLTGHKPFTGKNPLAVMIQIINQPIPSPRQFRQNLPMTVENVLMRALAKSPDERFPNMAAFAQTLSALLDESSRSSAIFSPLVTPSSPDDQPTIDLLEEDAPEMGWTVLCPFCRKETRAEAWKCEHCGKALQNVALSIQSVRKTVVR